VSLFSFDFLHLCWPTPQQLTVVHLGSSGPCSDTYTLPEHAPQNCSGNGSVFVEVKSLSIFDFSPFCSPTVQDLCGIFLHDPRLLWIPIHSLKNPHQTVYETVRFLLRNVKFYFCLFDMIFTNCPALTPGSFHMISGSFGYLCTLWGHSMKPFMKWICSCRGMSSSNFLFPIPVIRKKCVSSFQPLIVAVSDAMKVWRNFLVWDIYLKCHL